MDIRLPLVSARLPTEDSEPAGVVPGLLLLLVTRCHQGKPSDSGLAAAKREAPPSRLAAMGSRCMEWLRDSEGRCELHDHVGAPAPTPPPPPLPVAPGTGTGADTGARGPRGNTPSVASKEPRKESWLREPPPSSSTSNLRSCPSCPTPYGSLCSPSSKSP